MIKRVVLVGATGLVGGAVLNTLKDNPEYSIEVISRAKVDGCDKSTNIYQHIVNFDQLDQHAEIIQGDVLVCALGTTIKTVGSKEKFRHVDFDYVVNLAKLAATNGVKQLIVISAVGANPDSKVFFSKTKGEMEVAIKALGFDSINILRPSLLVGKRKEFRLGEHLGIWLTAPIVKLLPQLYRPISALDLSNKIVQLISKPEPGIHLYQGNRLRTTV